MLRSMGAQVMPSWGEVRGQKGNKDQKQGLWTEWPPGWTDMLVGCHLQPQRALWAGEPPGQCSVETTSLATGSPGPRPEGSVHLTGGLMHLEAAQPWPKVSLRFRNKHLIRDGEN